MSQHPHARSHPRPAARLGRRRFLHAAAAAGALLWADGAWAAPPKTPSPPKDAPAPPPPPHPGDPPAKQTATGVTVPPTDPAIDAQAVTYPGLVSPLLAYVAAPKGSALYPAVLLLHDDAGLTEHFRDIARRLAKAGYVALVPDLLSRQGGTEKVGDPVKVSATLRDLAPGQLLQDLNTSVRYLEAYPLVSKTRIGALGFGVGAAIMWFVVAANSDIKAAVSVSGIVPPDRAATSMSAAVLSIFGENDRRDQEAINDFDLAMKKAGRPFRLKLEPKAGHDFFDDTTSRYVADAARDAWGMTLDWFGEHLKG